MLASRFLPREGFRQVFNQLSADFTCAEVVDLGKRFRREVLHVGFAIEKELQEDSLDLEEHSLNLDLCISIDLHYLEQVYGAVSLHIEADSLGAEDPPEHPLCKTLQSPCIFIHL